MENKYFRILSTAVEDGISAKYYFYDFYGELLNPFDYLESYFEETENFLDTLTLMKLMMELRYYLVSLPYQDVGYLFYYYFTKRNPLFSGVEKKEVKKELLEDEIEEYYSSLNKYLGQKQFLFQNFPSGYQRWESTFLDDLKDDARKLSEQKAFNERLMIESNTLFSKKKNTFLKKRKDEKYTSELQIVDASNEYLISENDGSSLFNRCKTSESIPFVWWKDEKGKDYYKVFSPINEEKIPRFDLFELPIKPENNTIYFFIFKRNISKSGKILRISKDNYLLCFITLGRSTLTCDYDKYIENESGIGYILKYVRSSFGVKKTPHSLIFNQKITTKLYFPPQSVDSSIIFYLIQTLPSLSHFFYSEGRRSYAEDPVMVISYRGFKRYLYSDEHSLSGYMSSTVKVSIGSNVFIDGETLLECKVTRAYGEMELECFIDELSALLNIYTLYFVRTKDFISDFIEEVSKEIFEEEEGEEITTSVLYYKKLSQITSKTGDMYSGASKKVQCLKQPIVISQSAVKDWKELRTKAGEERTILSFPPQEGREGLPSGERNLPHNTPHLWVCPDDEYPYPRLFSNTEKLYPYLPICQTNPMDEKEKEILTKYYTLRDSVSEEVKISQNENLIKTDKIRRYGEAAELSLDLSTILKNLFDSQFQTFTRLGTDVGPNSFIAAVLLACNAYRNVESKRSRERVLAYFRNEMKNYVNVVRQELYIESEENILSLISNEETNIDSYVFHRAIEEMLGVNIYVFKYSESLKEINFEIPRNALYHIRTYNPERRTILIFKHYGNDADALLFPHYEYITTLPSDLDDEFITESERKPNTLSFSFGERVYSAFILSQQFYTFTKENSIVMNNLSSPSNTSYENSPSLLEEEKKVLSSECRINSYNKIDWNEILKSKKIISQYVDGFGKCRIINIELPLGSDSPSVKKKVKRERKVISLFIPPAPPLNVMIEEKVYPLERENVSSILPHFENSPSSIIKEGIFFKILDFEGGIFIPFEKEKVENDFSNYILVKRSANILRESVEWCWRCDALKLEAREWIEKYITPSFQQKEDRPNFDKIRIAFPIIENITTPVAIRSLKEWWPSVFGAVEDKISLPMSVYIPMKKYLIERDIATKGMDVSPERYLQSEIKNSFSIREENIVLFGEENYINYVSSVTKKNVNYISNIVNFSLPFPQMIKIRSGVYIIQSVIDDSLDNCLLVCEDWEREKKNNASTTDERVNTKDFSYGILIQTSDGRIIPQQDFTKGKEEYLQVLFNQGKYFAMLKVL